MTKECDRVVRTNSSDHTREGYQMNRSRMRHERNSEPNTNGRKLRDIAFLFAGLGIGSGVALLLAPAEGEDVRYAIRRGYRKSIKKISRETEALRDQAEDLIQHALHIRERGSDLLHLGRPQRVVQRKAA